MNERWNQISPEADPKQEKRFEIWINAEGIRFDSEESKKKYQQRCTLIRDAVQMKKMPERIPICPSPGTFPLKYSGLTWIEAMNNPEALATAFKKYVDDFDPDVAVDGKAVLPARLLELLDYKLVRWAGHGVGDNCEFQYVEDEFMKANDYQDLIDDPTYWFLSVYFPRIFGSLKPLDKFPMLPPVNEIGSLLGLVMPFADVEMSGSMERLITAGRETKEWLSRLDTIGHTIKAAGYPSISGGFTKAPFDVIGDTLRGTRQIMMDLFRRPELVIEACERLTPIMIKAGIQACNSSGNPTCFIPLHKGADGFMSHDQFLEFYWPSLKKVAIGLMDAGIVPLLFAEGEYNSRLEIITDLPKGKAIWFFDRSEMKKAKETVGKVSCIMGNFPLDLLCAGTPDEVRTYARQLVDTAGKGGGYIFSAGAGMTDSKAENVKAMIETVKEYGVYG